MKFDQNFIEKVRDANDIIDVISQYVQLKQSGSRFFGLCPFHGEKTPSFSVSQDKQVYHCFGCKASGNIYTFLQNHNGMSFPEAVEFLAAKASIVLPVVTQSAGEQERRFDENNQRKLMWKINAFAENYFHQALLKLPDVHPVKTYLQNRRIHHETLDRFKIGYAPDSWDSLVNLLEKNKVPLDIAEKLGLIRKRGEGKSGYFDLFRHRLMFPIHSHLGHSIGFGGRVLEDGGQPKYLNSPESFIFHKGRIFYGLQETAKHIRTEDAAIIVEGYTDFLALYQAGITNVVATLGTALTADHARLLKRYTKNIYILFDGDEAGQSAAERSLPILLKEGLFPRALILGEAMDPDEFIKANGAGALRAALVEAPELFMVLLNKGLEVKGTWGAAEQLQLIDKMAPLVAAASDPRLREIYFTWVVESFGVNVDWAKKALRQSLSQLREGGVHRRNEEKAREKSSFNSQEAENKGLLSQKVSTDWPKLSSHVSDSRGPDGEKVVVTGPPKAELDLLNLALLKEEYLQEILESQVVEEFVNPGLKEIFRRIEEVYRQMPSKFDSLTALLVEKVEPSQVVTLHLHQPLSDLQAGGAKKLMKDCIHRVRQAHLRGKSKELVSRLRGQSTPEQLKQLEQIMNIHKNRHSLNKDFEP